MKWLLSIHRLLCECITASNAVVFGANIFQLLHSNARNRVFQSSYFFCFSFTSEFFYCYVATMICFTCPTIPCSFSEKSSSLICLFAVSFQDRRTQACGHNSLNTPNNCYFFEKSPLDSWINTTKATHSRFHSIWKHVPYNWVQRGGGRWVLKRGRETPNHNKLLLLLCGIPCKDERFMS